MHLQCTGINKSFGATRALNGASLDVAEGSIHALLGENGAGKSTLNNILAGALQADGGVIELDGQSCRFASPQEAYAAGIGMVHQHFLLAGALTAAENILLGLRSSAWGWRFDRVRAAERVRELSARTGLQTDPEKRVRDMSVGERQRVEILKALARGTRLLLLDEPTAVLAPAEIETLFATLRTLQRSGCTIVIVTHKLDEVFALASHVTVLRRGATVHAGPIGAISRQELIRKMVGEDVSGLSLNASPQRAHAGARPLLELSDVSVGHALNVAGLAVHPGEIVGVAGVEGNGQEELAGVLTGMISAGVSARQMDFAGVPLLPLSIQARHRAGLANIPGDRQREGLVLEMSLCENVHLREPLEHRVLGLNVLDEAAMLKRAEQALKEFDVVPPDATLTAGALSGGNQQKVVIAREFGAQPKLIVANNPVRGLDVKAAAAVQAWLVAAARERAAGVLLISSDLDEVLSLSDRVFALYRGNLSEVGPRGVAREDLGRAMVGAGVGNVEAAA
jgi:simple sugar transport system ATP-binding protein